MTRHQLKQETTPSQDAARADVSAGTAAAAADTKPAVQQTDEEDSCKLCYMHTGSSDA